jgi:hypothetical protein
LIELRQLSTGIDATRKAQNAISMKVIKTLLLNFGNYTNLTTNEEMCKINLTTFNEEGY